MKSFVAVIGLIGAAAAAPLEDTPDVAQAKVEFKAVFDKVSSDAAAALEAAGAVVEDIPVAEPYVHVDIPAEEYVHVEPALEPALEPYVHVEVMAEPYMEPVAPVAPAAPAPLKLAPSPALPAVLPAAGFYAPHHLAYAGYAPYFAPGCLNNLGQAVPCYGLPALPKAE